MGCERGGGGFLLVLKQTLGNLIAGAQDLLPANCPVSPGRRKVVSDHCN